MNAGVPNGGIPTSSKRVMNLAHFVRQTARRYADEIALVWGERRPMRAAVSKTPA